MNAEALPATLSARRIKARKGITWLLFFSIVMFFAGLTSAYLVSKGGALYWAEFTLPTAFWWSTGLIVASSGTLQLALMRAQRGGTVAPWVVATLVLGLAFSWFQFKGWGEMAGKGLAVTGQLKHVRGEYGKDYYLTRKGVPLAETGGRLFLPGDVAQEHPLNAEMGEARNTASSYFYVLTGAHYLHILGGLVALVVMSVKAFLGRYGREDHQGLWAGTVYWHFLAGLWIYLLLFLAYVH